MNDSSSVDENQWAGPLYELSSEQLGYLRDYQCCFCGRRVAVRVLVDGLMGQCLECIDQESRGVHSVGFDST